jgi:hypothetical protein
MCHFIEAAEIDFCQLRQPIILNIGQGGHKGNIVVRLLEPKLSQPLRVHLMKYFIMRINKCIHRPI